MALLKSTRSAQYPQVAEFTFNYNDTMVDVAGATRDFGSLTGGSVTATTYAFEPVPLPPNAVLVGGDITTEIAFNNTSVTATVGDALLITRYLGATAVTALGRVPLVLTGYRSDGGNIRLGLNAVAAATAGKATLRVQYIITGRAQETVIL